MDHSVQPLHVISYDGDHYWWGNYFSVMSITVMGVTINYLRSHITQLDNLYTHGHLYYHL